MIKLAICFNFLNLKSYKKIDERTQSKLHTWVFLFQNCFFFGSIDQRGRRKSRGRIARWNSTFKSNFKMFDLFHEKNCFKNTFDQLLWPCQSSTSGLTCLWYISYNRFNEHWIPSTSASVNFIKFFSSNFSYDLGLLVKKGRKMSLFHKYRILLVVCLPSRGIL